MRHALFVATDRGRSATHHLFSPWSIADIVVVAVFYVAHFRSALYRVAAAQHAPGN